MTGYANVYASMTYTMQEGCSMMVRYIDWKCRLEDGVTVCDGNVDEASSVYARAAGVIIRACIVYTWVPPCVSTCA